MAEDTMGTRGSRWRVHGRPTLPYYITTTLFNPYLFTVSTVRHSPVVQSSLRCDTLRQRALIDTVLYHGDTWGNAQGFKYYWCEYIGLFSNFYVGLSYDF